jgi:hypothetical protein
MSRLVTDGDLGRPNACSVGPAHDDLQGASQVDAVVGRNPESDLANLSQWEPACPPAWPRASPTSRSAGKSGGAGNWSEKAAGIFFEIMPINRQARVTAPSTQAKRPSL